MDDEAGLLKGEDDEDDDEEEEEEDEDEEDKMLRFLRRARQTGGLPMPGGGGGAAAAVASGLAPPDDPAVAAGMGGSAGGSSSSLASPWTRAQPTCDAEPPEEPAAPQLALAALDADEGAGRPGSDGVHAAIQDLREVKPRVRLPRLKLARERRRLFARRGLRVRLQLLLALKTPTHRVTAAAAAPTHELTHAPLFCGCRSS